jgi:hypothetical protein
VWDLRFSRPWLWRMPSSEIWKPILCLTRNTRCNIPEDDIVHSHRRENRKSYIALLSWSLKRRCNVFPLR